MYSAVSGEAWAARSKKPTTAPEEIVDTEAGNNISRLVASELALMGGEFEPLLHRRLLERGALCYKLAGQERLAEGPSVLCVDESGSMIGPKDEWAKALAMALMETAARERRKLAYIHFSSAVAGIDRFDPKAGMGLEDLLGFVESFAGGGTNIGDAIAHAQIEIQGQALKNADVILITDGVDSRIEQTIQSVRDLKSQTGARLHGLAIGCQFPDALRAECSLYEELADLTSAEKLDGIFNL